MYMYKQTELLFSNTHGLKYVPKCVNTQTFSLNVQNTTLLIFNTMFTFWEANGGYFFSIFHYLYSVYISV